MEDHDQAHERVSGTDAALKKRLIVSASFTAIIFIAELAGGYYFNSLALMTDAAHVFMDVFALALSWFAIRISELAPTQKRTFGLHRVEVFVSFLNSLSLFVITLFIFYKAYERTLSPEPVDAGGTLVIAIIGLAVNVIVALWLMRYAVRDLNVKSAYVHVVGDAAASVGVIIAAIIIRFTGWYAVDPVISIFICLIIIYSAYKIIRDSSNILLEGVPAGVDLTSVVADIKSVEGVESVHSVHIWSICHNVYALSAHVDITPEHRWRMGEIFSAVNERLAQTYHIFYTTLQAECLGCEQGGVLRRLLHKEHNHNH